MANPPDEEPNEKKPFPDISDEEESIVANEFQRLRGEVDKDLESPSKGPGEEEPVVLGVPYELPAVDPNALKPVIPRTEGGDVMFDTSVPLEDYFNSDLKVDDFKFNLPPSTVRPKFDSPVDGQVRWLVHALKYYDGSDGRPSLIDAVSDIDDRVDKAIELITSATPDVIPWLETLPFGQRKTKTRAYERLISIDDNSDMAYAVLHVIGDMDSPRHALGTDNIKSILDLGLSHPDIEVQLHSINGMRSIGNLDDRFRMLNDYANKKDEEGEEGKGGKEYGAHRRVALINLAKEFGDLNRLTNTADSKAPTLSTLYTRWDENCANNFPTMRNHVYEAIINMVGWYADLDTLTEPVSTAIQAALTIDDNELQDYNVERIEQRYGFEGLRIASKLGSEYVAGRAMERMRNSNENDSVYHSEDDPYTEQEFAKQKASYLALIAKDAQEGLGEHDNPNQPAYDAVELLTSFEDTDAMFTGLMEILADDNSPSDDFRSHTLDKMGEAAMRVKSANPDAEIPKEVYSMLVRNGGSDEFDAFGQKYMGRVNYALAKAGKLKDTVLLGRQVEE